VKKGLLVLAPLVAALILTAPAAKPQDAKGAVPAGNAENGKRVFVKYGCYTCHGYDGHGGAGPKLAPRPIATVAFVAIVRHPPPSGMPIFTAKVVSDSDLNDMWAYLKSIPDPPALKDIPILNQ
jgi:mono/diheme cytochrome c family protein